MKYFTVCSIQNCRYNQLLLSSSGHWSLNGCRLGIIERNFVYFISIKSFGKLNSVRFGNSWKFCQIYLFHFKQPKDSDIFLFFIPIKKINTSTRIEFYHNKQIISSFSSFSFVLFYKKPNTHLTKSLVAMWMLCSLSIVVCCANSMWWTIDNNSSTIIGR